MASNATNRYTGELLYISFGGVAIQADFQKFDVSESIEYADTTAGTARDESHIVTIQSAEFSYEGLQVLGTAGSVVRQALALGTSGTLIYAPEGTATGKPKYSCVASVTGYQATYPFNDVVKESISLRKNGAWLAHFELSESVFP